MGLRQYQLDLVEEARHALAHHRSVLAVLPTGGGKTQVFCTIAELSTKRNNNVLILVHRAELIEQASNRLSEMGVEHGVIAPGHPVVHAQVQVASIYSAARRLAAFPWSPNLLLVDEAHHCSAKSWKQVLEGYPNAKTIGWTATPRRLDGKGLSDSFEALVEGPSTRRLIEMGYLASYRLFAPPVGADLAGLRKRAGDYQREELEQRMVAPGVTLAAVRNYKKFGDGRQAIAFCVSLKHAEQVTANFASAGLPVEQVDGSLSADERQERIGRFRDGKIRILVSVDLVSEGFDVPACECAILLRPTASLALYLQQVGRALRPSGRDAILLDCVGNSLKHGLPDDTREWSLDGTAPKSRSELSAVPIRVCPSCYSVHKPAPTCPYCGHVHVDSRELPKEKEADLAEVRRKQEEQREWRREVGRARTLQELQAIAAQRGYKPGWAHAVLKSRKA